MKKEIWVNDDNGFCCSTTRIEVDEKELQNTYINDYGVEFLKHDGDLYLREYGEASNFKRVRSECQIEGAFNPDRTSFEMWRKNREE